MILSAYDRILALSRRGNDRRRGHRTGLTPVEKETYPHWQAGWRNPPLRHCAIPTDRASSARMRFAVLGSGSGGNATVVECGGLRLMIDAGLSAKQLALRLRLLGIEPESLDGVLITHEHGDHVRGLKIF